MNYRLATLHDLPKIFQLEQALFGEHAFPYFVLRQYYDCHREGFWVAEKDGEIAGYVLHARGHNQMESWILALAVDPNVQGQGVGQRLMGSCLSSAETAVKLTVDPSNQGACALYEKLGFEMVEHDEAYFGEGAGRWVMRYNPEC